MRLLGCLILRSLTKTQNQAKMEPERKTSSQCSVSVCLFCFCWKREKRARHLLWWTAVWKMCTVWFVLQGHMLVNYKTMVMFCCFQFLCQVSFASSFRLLWLALVGACLYRSYTTRVPRDFMLTKSTAFENFRLRWHKHFLSDFQSHPLKLDDRQTFKHLDFVSEVEKCASPCATMFTIILST